MSAMWCGRIGLLLMFFLLLAVGEIRAATLYVANNGVDSGTCGAQTAPCRSITQTIANASAGDTVIVGPGRYAENYIGIDKALTVESSHGAQETLLQSDGDLTQVRLMVSGIRFGRPGHGFTLISQRYNIVHFLPDTNGSSVSGNILTEFFIYMQGSGHTLAQNHFISVGYGQIGIIGTGHSLIENTGHGSADIWGSGHSLTNNVFTIGENNITINASSGIIIRANSFLGGIDGSQIVLNPGSNVAINENNFFGQTSSCYWCNWAVYNNSGASIDATNNFWGAASGPGPDPADEVYDEPGSSTVVAPFATQQFAIRAPGDGGGGNGAPVCTAAQAVPSMLWPANGQFVRVWIIGVGDPDNDPVRISISGVTQDEPTSGLVTGDTGPDATLFGSSVDLRAQRDPGGNGRVYRVKFDANDGKGGTCAGAVTVQVPNSQKPGQVIIDDGQNFDSTRP
ncbi:MAG: hypothetical protein KGJ40_06200 [candidate division NC10 bacterium]|nr:hypothetical protein [candidate division NC10 bacterium]MDE2484788.1 hypothetical protein [candidate division NC10 bacterium]